MKKLIKRILFVLLAIILAIQVPFIYRRYKIGQLSGKIGQLQKSAAENNKNTTPNFKEYTGVLHVHTSLGGHSTGGFDELIAAANSNALDFVIMTEHYSDQYDTSALTLKGRFGKTLFVNGHEIDTNDGGRFLLIPGSSEAASFGKMDSAAFLEKIHSEGRIAINNYPERSRSGNYDYDGMEVYSLHVNSKQVNPFTAAFDLLWSFPVYPELTVATIFRRNDDYLQRYDEIAAKKRLLLAAGADAHSNKGFYLLADDSGNKLLGFKIDPYETIFRLVRMHVLIESDMPVTNESLIQAMRSGHAFAGFDVLGDTSGFTFSADNGRESGIMGDEIALAQGVDLKCAAPGTARFVLIKNGEKISETAAATKIAVTVYEPGTYRIEVYLDQLGSPFDQAPWIMSNPIYVR